MRSKQLWCRVCKRKHGTAREAAGKAEFPGGPAFSYLERVVGTQGLCRWCAMDFSISGRVLEVKERWETRTAGRYAESYGN